MEKIIAITEHNTNDGCGMKSGYKVITNKQEIELLIDNEQSCCEAFGYFWSNDEPQDFIDAEVLTISITDTELNTKLLEEHIGTYGCDSGDTLFVNIDTNKGKLQFVAYNCHNGYYGHEAVIKSIQLNYKDYL